jgi:formylglycine-generating enzyme required for sulfatase activity
MALASPSMAAERLHVRDGSTLVFVPGGTFVVGIEGLSANSAPPHRVRLRPFWISQVPVVNRQYAEFLRANPGHPVPAFWEDLDFNQPLQPVVGIDWFQARKYCSWAGLFLPTEAQWEVAARGKDQRFYCWGDDEPTRTHANFRGGPGRSTPVGTYPAGMGPYGTLDQGGNVWEWCEDVWNDRAYDRPENTWNPVSKDGIKSERVARGGSWNYPAWNMLAAYRGRIPASEVCRNIGFRCVLPLQKSQNGTRRMPERRNSATSSLRPSREP